MSQVSQHRRKVVTFFADQDVGLAAVEHVLREHPGQVKYVVTVSDNEISGVARAFGCRTFCYKGITVQNAKAIFDEVDIIFLAWWPKIVPGYVIDAPKVGVINFHPSLLPYNRGKNYNFWTIVEDTPFGVTLHFADEGIDSGDIIFQSPIEKSWDDTGETLYVKAKASIVALFKARYLDILEGKYTRRPQNKEHGTFHCFKELDPASRIYLDKTYVAKDLLNLLRARTFKGKPSCYFYDSGKKYEVRISIKEVSDEFTD